MIDEKKSAAANVIIIGAMLLAGLVFGNQTHYTHGQTSYINRDGHRVAIPGQTSTGATARCRNGSWSYSEHRNGTCSQEGGVDWWVNDRPYVTDPELLRQLNAPWNNY